MTELVFVTDDDRVQRRLLEHQLQQGGYVVASHDSGEACLTALETTRPGVVVLDLVMAGLSGLETLSRIRDRHRDLPVVILTGVADVDVVVQAMQFGAFDYLVKPVEPTKLLTTVRNAVERSQMARRLAELEERVEHGDRQPMLGRSAAMRELFRQIDRVGATEFTVLIVGESGTGKELVAQAIHEASARRAGPLVALNCAAIPESLQESELFGHERGAFTGAMQRRRGRFELADRGTLFLDEVAELSLTAQAKLLRVLEEKKVSRVGSDEEVESNFRLVAATHRDLSARVAEGRFREDLYFRVAVLEVRVPPLRERGEDVLLLAAHFTAHSAAAVGRPGLRLAPATADILRAYPWPGNVRELENAVRRAVVVCDGDVIRPQDLPERIRAATESGVWSATAARLTPAGGVPVLARAERSPQTLAELERQAIESAIRRNPSNFSAAASQLGISRSTLYRKLREYHLDAPTPETPAAN